MRRRRVTGYVRYTITPFGASRAWPAPLDAAGFGATRRRHRRRRARGEPARRPGRSRGRAAVPTVVDVSVPDPATSVRVVAGRPGDA